MLERRLSSTISRVVERVARKSLDIEFHVNGSSQPAHAIHDAEPDESESPGSTDAMEHGMYRLKPGLTFETFVVGQSNLLAHAAASKVAEEPGRVYNPLYLYSDVGLGKTHLLHAIGHRLIAAGLRVIYVSSERFTNEYIKAIREGSTEQFRERYRGADALLVDDIQFIASKEQTQEGFFHTFNELHMNGKQIVVTGDEPARKSMLEERIQSRLEGGLVVDIQPPDYETRYAILQSKAQQLTVRLSSTVLDMLARRTQANVRELEGCLNRIVAYAQLTDSPVTPELASQALRSLLSQQASAAADPNAVMAAVASQSGITAEALQGRKRDKKTAMARRMAMYLLREESRLPSTRVGEILGGKDHSTVLYAQKKFEEQLEIDPMLRQELASVRQALSSRAVS